MEDSNLNKTYKSSIDLASLDLDAGTYTFQSEEINPVV
jgi:hypothetical protein